MKNQDDKTVVNIEMLISPKHLGKIKKAAKLEYDWGGSGNIEAVKLKDNHIQEVIDDLIRIYSRYDFRQSVSKEVYKLLWKMEKDLEPTKKS